MTQTTEICRKASRSLSRKSIIVQRAFQSHNWGCPCHCSNHDGLSTAWSKSKSVSESDSASRTPIVFTTGNTGGSNGISLLPLANISDKLPLANVSDKLPLANVLADRVPPARRHVCVHMPRSVLTFSFVKCAMITGPSTPRCLERFPSTAAAHVKSSAATKSKAWTMFAMI